MKRFLSTIAFLFISPVVVYALGLGDVVVNSALNQPLDAKIELLSPSPDDLDSLKIGLADSNAFAKAGIERPFGLSKLKFNLRRSVDDGDDYISISTQAAIQEPFLNFLIEATWANGRILREYTILLDPPSYDFRTRMENTVNTEEVAVSTIQDSTTEYTSEQSKTPSQITNYVGGNYGPTVRADTLSEIAYKTRPDKSISLDQMMMAIYRANPEAFINQNINGLKGGYVLDIPDEAAIYELTAAEARRKVRSQHAAWGDVIFEEGAVSNEQTQLVNEIDVDKQKNEVTGSTSKIYAQKGTGNARHASKKAPIFVGGGVAHGPKGQLNYKKRKLNKSEKKLSIASLITKKNKINDLIILDDFQKEILKTKEMNTILIKFEAKNSIIIADKKSKDNIIKSIRNIPNVKITDINHFSAYDLSKFKKIIFTETSIKELEKRY